MTAYSAPASTFCLSQYRSRSSLVIITAAKEGETPYYTNSSHLPVGYTEDIFEALAIQDDLQTLYTSGTVFHAFLGEKLPDWKAAANLVRKIAENHRLPYYTLSPTYSICKNHGYLAGEQKVCPHCGEKTEVYSRITGYYRPVQNWNEGKTQEFKDRKLYDIEHSVLRPLAATGTDGAPCADPAPVIDLSSAPAPKTAKSIFFARTTCPNCRVAEAMMDKAGFAYNKLIAEENIDLVNKYGIKGAPTLVLDDGETVLKFYGVPEIKKFLANNK